MACRCTDRNHNPKRLYATHQDAQINRDHARDQRGVSLRIYECPDYGGWHLTSSPERTERGYWSGW